MQPGAEILTPLRQDLSILPTSPAADGARRFLIHDPVRGQFHRISEPVMRALAVWRPMPVPAMLARLPGFTEDSLQTLTGFLARNRLFATPPGGDPEALARIEAAHRRPLHEELLHRYLYFRIPLFRPQRFLDRVMPWVQPWLRRRTAVAVGTLGAVGLLLALRQWESFVSTFLYFFTPSGLVFYGLALIVIKALHELGHAIAARHYGAHVPVIGVAFLVMFPILYTDTTDAYRIPDQRKRAVIDAAGMMVELTIACLAVFAWSVLPDGPLRSAAFFAATTSWAMSLLVNLNPCMRFDGYYLLTDLLGLTNLQQTGFDYGRWRMRKTLLGVDEGRPDTPRPRLMLAYAYSTWIYRFFLFVGIAILVHHLFPKAIGIVLFVAEIGMFIVRPVLKELKHWWSLRMQILSNPRGRTSLLLGAALLGALFVPWRAQIIAPALVRPAQQTTVFSPEPGAVEAVLVADNVWVEAGTPLLHVRSDALTHERALAELRVALAEAELRKTAADRTERREASLRQEQLIEARAALAAIDARLERLTIRAASAGHVRHLSTALAPGMGASRRTALLRIDGRGAELVALPKDSDSERIDADARVRFISDTLETKPREFAGARLSPTAQARVDETLLTLVEGGPITVTEDAQGRLMPDIPVSRLTATADGVVATERGVAVIEAKPQSAASRIWRRVAGVLLRETDF